MERCTSRQMPGVRTCHVLGARDPSRHPGQTFPAWGGITSAQVQEKGGRSPLWTPGTRFSGLGWSAEGDTWEDTWRKQLRTK